MTPDAAFDTGNGAAWLGLDTTTTLYNHTLKPNAETVDCGRNSVPKSGLFPARSWHLGIVNVAMLDGSVIEVSNAIDLDVWRAMATINGGEVTKK